MSKVLGVEQVPHIAFSKSLAVNAAFPSALSYSATSARCPGVHGRPIVHTLSAMVSEMC